MGNIFRSATAETVFRKKVAAVGLANEIYMNSAGTHHYPHLQLYFRDGCCNTDLRHSGVTSIINAQAHIAWLDLAHTT